MMNNNLNEKLNPYLELKHIDKVFGHTCALKDMNLSIHLGDIIGLIGPNGAGKSTMIKVMTGVHKKTSGRIIFEGEETVDHLYDANVAKSKGVACAYQELSLCTNLTVYENFIVTHANHKLFGTAGWRKQAQKSAKDFLNEVFPNNKIDVKTIIEELSLAERQMVEIAKAFSTKNLKILLLDEPTSSLTSDCIKQLHDSMKKLSKKGVAIIYITHKMDEIDKVCNKITVVKSGTVAWNGLREETTFTELLEILGGKVNVTKKQFKHTEGNDQTIEIMGYTSRTLKDIKLQVNKGEIIGISGLAGSGQNELLLSILEASKSKRKSEIKLFADVSYVSGDRQKEGIFPLWNIEDNINISSLHKITKNGLLSKSKQHDLAQFWYDKLKFVARGVEDEITSLSGGNQQKALIARGLASDADLIILNDPTCGVDIQTKQEIYKLLEEAKEQGKSIILHSTEDLEMEQCDRVYIMHEGRIIAELRGEEITVNAIIKTSFKEVVKSNKVKGGNEDNKEVGLDRIHLLKSTVLKSRSFLAIFTLLMIFVINGLLNPRIFSYMGIELLYSSAIPLIFIALGQMFLVISGGIDLGNGMAVGLMNVITAFTIVQNPQLGLVFSLLLIIGYGIIGAIVHLTKIPAIVITLGASFIWLGLALIISPTPGGQAPKWLIGLYRYQFPLIPMPIVISIIAAVFGYWIVKKSKYGIIINGFGNNPITISRAGWSALTVMVVTYAISGAFVVIGGLMITAVANSGDGNSTASYQMLSIATIILGGCEFKGGIGNPVGVVAAALAISSISALLTFLGIDSNLQSAVTGLILIMALAIKLLGNRREFGK